MKFESFDVSSTLYIETVPQSTTEDSIRRDFIKILQSFPELSTIDANVFIQDLELPKFTSSGRNQGYAVILFDSPKTLDTLMQIYAKRNGSDCPLMKLRWITMTEWLQYKDEYLQKMNQK